MGMFSWKCAVSKLSIANVHSGQSPKRSQCYLITPTQSIYEDAYDGYGVFGGKDVYELLGDGDRDKGIKNDLSGKGKFEIKIVLKQFYKGQTYDQLLESESCPDQGFFYS
ncbi:hypothetical protein [Paenibacillus glacialis]|uniref:Uncharacterized protein n=1 Tax=Paenibacillus glacialis TaxID=494026 RepID=A0A168NP62_9BACL|nr:hypothetical protein [Paenibacillus glacialis]OAB45988.1 hypothetical protein PGLA_00905 [Paenibacillus glacialis]